MGTMRRIQKMGNIDDEMYIEPQKN